MGKRASASKRDMETAFGGGRLHGVLDRHRDRGGVSKRLKRYREAAVEDAIVADEAACTKYAVVHHSMMRKLDMFRKSLAKKKDYEIKTPFSPSRAAVLDAIDDFREKYSAFYIVKARHNYSNCLTISIVRRVTCPPESRVLEDGSDDEESEDGKNKDDDIDDVDDEDSSSDFSSSSSSSSSSSASSD